MITPTLNDYEQYISDHNMLQNARVSKDPNWLKRLREQGFKSFSDLGLPTARRGNEKWKYTNVRPIATTIFSFPFDTKPDAELSGPV